jgi:hypothetical protein
MSSYALVVRTSFGSKHDYTSNQDDDESMVEKRQRKEQKRARKRTRKEEWHQRHSCATKKTAAASDATVSMEELRQRRLDREAREQRRGGFQRLELITTNNPLPASHGAANVV